MRFLIEKLNPDVLSGIGDKMPRNTEKYKYKDKEYEKDKRPLTDTTLICIKNKIKEQSDACKVHVREPYNDVIEKLLNRDYKTKRL